MPDISSHSPCDLHKLNVVILGPNASHFYTDGFAINLSDSFIFYLLIMAPEWPENTFEYHERNDLL